MSKQRPITTASADAASLFSTATGTVTETAQKSAKTRRAPQAPIGATRADLPSLTPRGYRGRGNGRVSYVEAPPEWRGTTVQACGLFPWAIGGATPTLGVPIGRHLRAGTSVCFDPINWFERGRFIPNPSYFTLGLPGLGKSTFTRRQVLGLSAMGVRPLVLGDLKPDYVDLIAAIGGQVVKLGRGLGALNVLDVGALDEAATRLPTEQAERLRSEAHGRRLSVVTGLILIVRGSPVEDYERAVLSAALRVVLASKQRSSVRVVDDLTAQLARLRRAVEAAPWTGPGGASDRAVLGALLEAAVAQATLIPAWSGRGLAAAARVSATTVAASLRRLSTTAWVRREEAATSGGGPTWRLVPPVSSTATPAATGVPTLVDLVRVLEEGPVEVRAVTLDRGDEERYRAVVDPLHRSLLALLDGPLGDTFSRPTTSRIALDSPGVAIDVSGISSSDTALQAAVLLACWSDGFGAVEAANALADAGVAPQQRFFVVLDELWRVLRSGVGMVDNVDALTRLNRTQGVGMAQVTHTMSDLQALSNAEDIAKAKGFVERAGALVCGGLPSQELDELQEVVHFTRAERDLITSWSTPESWDARQAPPGRGKFLLKVGRRPGVPVEVKLTSAEESAGVNNTNKRWTTGAPAAALTAMRVS